MVIRYVQSLLCFFSLPENSVIRFAVFAGTTSRRISTNVVLLVGESIPTMLWSSSPLPLKSMCHASYIMARLLMMYLGDKSHKRLTQQKKQRERERKELDTLGRRHLANVRVVQRNIVYVVGIGPRFAKEEVRPFLPQIF